MSANGIPGLQGFGIALKRLGSIPSKIAKEASARVSELIDDQFETETDPYGKPWETLSAATVRRKHGDTRILQRSEDLRKKIKVKPMRAAGIAVTFDPPYASYHQTGTRYMPARKLFPEGAFPAKWNAALNDLTQRELRSQLKDFGK